MESVKYFSMWIFRMWLSRINLWIYIITYEYIYPFFFSWRLLINLLSSPSRLLASQCLLGWNWSKRMEKAVLGFLWSFQNWNLNFKESCLGLTVIKKTFQVNMVSLNYADALWSFSSNNPHEMTHLNSSGDQCYFTEL